MLFTIKPPVITMSIVQLKKKSYCWALHPQAHMEKPTYANRLDCFWAGWPCLLPFPVPKENITCAASGCSTSSRHQPPALGLHPMYPGVPWPWRSPLAEAPTCSPCPAQSHWGAVVSSWRGAMVSLDREAAALPGSCMVWQGAGIISQHP